MALNRISDIFFDAIELYCAKKATQERKVEFEKTMDGIVLPQGCDKSYQIKYKMIKEGHWWYLRVYAQLRILYLKFRKIY